MIILRQYFPLVICLVLSACGPGGGSNIAPLNSAAGVATPPDVTSPPGGDPNCVDNSSDLPTLRESREDVCVLVNIERAKVGAQPLALEAARSEVAQAHATDMVTRNYFSHTTPEGLTPSDRLNDAGISWRTWGENIAMNPGSADDVVRQWMNSSGHRANILSQNFKRLGVGFDGGRWVQVFTD